MKTKSTCCDPAIISICLLIMSLSLVPEPTVAQEEKQLLSMNNIFTAGLFKPLPMGYLWKPGGKGFVYNLRGTLWSYDLPSAEKKRLNSLPEIQSQLKKLRPSRETESVDTSNATGRFNRSPMRISPDGNMLVSFYDNDLYIYDLSSGEARFITNDPEPEEFQVFSPDNKKVAYTKGNDIYYVNLESGEETRLTDNNGNEEIWNGVADWVYEEELTVRRAFWWSPDSTKIAYLQFDTTPVLEFQIIDHLQLRPVPERQKFPLTGEANSIVKLGVVSIADSQTLWIDTGENNDVYIFQADWTHSGNELSYHWMNREQNRLELRFANSDTGESRTAVVEESESWINPSGNWLIAASNLLFLEDDSFLWGSERSGYRHIYYYDSKGTLIKQLTSGEWQVEDICGFSAENNNVYFTATEKSPIERHLYAIDLMGNNFRRITEGDGTHNITVSPDGDYFIDIYSNVISPPSVVINKTSGKTVAVLEEGDIPALNKFDLTYPEFVTVKSEEGETLFAKITLPPRFDPQKKYPVIVYVYGGPGIQLVTNSWGGYLYYFQQILAAKGFILFTLDNRGSWGRGLSFESVVHWNMGELELKDQIEGVKYLQSLPYVDGERIGIIGGSYGGYMTLLALFRAPEFFKVGVAMSPGTDWRHYDTIYTERYMGTPQDNPDGYRKSSVLTYASKLEGKLYIIHGMMDNNVHLQQVIELVEQLIKAGKDFKLMLYPGERHGIGTPYRFIHEYNSIITFFNKNLNSESSQQAYGSR